ncbi:tRNA (N(6)-L-threonylcarbamoyladenosine(37)-C(2))-methylthiotransferase MtaB [Parvularcula sp. IMCC14364]|uniref:tRNA (N(6)-L-threonylcarbamoyladenosine(37)-C(2))- methylthiotransferase MtaB n=1 Tax=Parvularcula sp. IMCC14364 TaxID=3067902 RepID=UPI0027412A12|nr:tRNA (N(6)-L-threonylcarbamoyladenosine(37)-C(2))-methylthiotransferase MtaB [Parvularcula sp. IMCC14364]
MSDRPTSNHGAATEVVSMGCRLNGYESEKMAAHAKNAGLQDAVIINSCAVTNEAVRQTRQKIRQAKRNTPDKKIIVTGCAAQIDPGSFELMPEVSAVIGNAQKMQADIWKTLGHKPAETSLVSDIMAETTLTTAQPDPSASKRTRAYVQIQNGCDHRCTFCIIPYGRGNSRSVPIEEVISEVRQLTQAGTREVVLTGVDITSYGPDLPGEPDLGTLVARLLAAVPDLPRLRLSSIDEAEIDERLFELLVTEERITPYLHLSLQSGDNMILKRMKRRHTREQAIEFCRKISACRPEMAFGADIIAGFPTETEEMFENSVSLVSACDLSYLHVFPYSPRQGTPAARMPQLDRETIKDRSRRLRAAGDAALSKHLDSLAGRSFEVLTEKATDTAKLARGRLANFAEVTFDPKGDMSLLDPGHLVKVMLTGHDGRILTGSPVEKTVQ